MNAVTVIIPALNEGENISRLVAELHAVQPGLSVIVVDNGSTDDTASRASAAGALVASEPRRGYGYACAAGADAARSEILAFMDGDGSFLPAELPGVLAPLLEGRADFVLGSRHAGQVAPGAMPPHQRFGNWLAARMMGWLYGLPLSDIGPYRAIRSDLLESLAMGEMTYGWPVEMIAKAARRGARILEVPVSYYNRRAGRSKVSGTLKGSLLAAWYIIGVTLRYAWPPHRRKAAAQPPAEDA